MMTTNRNDQLVEVLDRLAAEYPSQLDDLPRKTDMWWLHDMFSSEMKRLADSLASRRRWGGRVDPAELLSEATLELFSEKSASKLKGWREVRSTVNSAENFARSFVYAAVYRVHKRIVRNRFPDLYADYDPPLAYSDTPFDIENTELVHKVREALSDVSEDDRELLLMRYAEGLTLRNIAERKSLNYATASQRVWRATKRLQRALANRGFS